MIIIDDGTCTEDFQCGGWLGSKALYGDLASKDSPVCITHCILNLYVGNGSFSLSIISTTTYLIIKAFINFFPGIDFLSF